MPIYEYECCKCGNQAQVLQKFTDAPLEECNLCHGRMKKLISQSSFHLKGTGWYVTDYASKSGGGHASSTKSESVTSTAETKTPESSKAKESSSSEVKTD
jgi:putative FmdB family regulatory protein